MSKLTLIRGLPGSGKSTHAKKLTDAYHVEADMFFVSKEGYFFQPHLVPQAHSWCHRQAAKQLELGNNVVVSNTFTRLWEIEKYKQMAEALGCEFEVLKCTGTYGSIHNIPEEVMKKMTKRWEDYPGEIHV